MHNSNWDFQSILAIWYRNYLYFKKHWLVSFLWVFIEPLFFLIAFGYGLGFFISNVEGVSYFEFFFPALLVNSAMFVSFFISTYDNLSKLLFQKTFAYQLITPISPQEIVLGEILWGGTKGAFSAVGILIVGLSMGLVALWKIPLILGFVFLVSCLFSALGFLVVTFVKNFDQIIYPTSGLIIPMSLFSGTYFPISNYPAFFKYFIYLFPLTHAVEFCRSFLLNQYTWLMVGNLIYLVAALVAFSYIAVDRFQKLVVTDV